MICTLTARRLKPGAYEEFRAAWDIGGRPSGWTHVYHCRDVEDPDVVLSFGLFDGSLEELREAQTGSGASRRSTGSTRKSRRSCSTARMRSSSS
jgi:hypothetical protein